MVVGIKEKYVENVLLSILKTFRPLREVLKELFYLNVRRRPNFTLDTERPDDRILRVVRNCMF